MALQRIFSLLLAITYVVPPFLADSHGWPWILALYLLLLIIALLLLRGGSAYIRSIGALFSINVRDVLLSFTFAIFVLTIMKLMAGFFASKFPVLYERQIIGFDPLTFMYHIYDDRIIAFFGSCSIAVTKAIIGDVMFRWIIWQPSILNTESTSRILISALILATPEIAYGLLVFIYLFFIYSYIISAYFYGGGRVGRVFTMSFFLTFNSTGYIFMKA